MLFQKLLCPRSVCLNSPLNIYIYICLYFNTVDKVVLLTCLVFCDLIVCVFAEPGYEFDKESLLKYNHMSFGGPPVTVETVEEEEELMRNDDKESAIG